MKSFTQRTPLVVATLWLLVGCGKALTQSECETLLDHYTSSLVLSENPNAAPSLIAEKQRLARELAQREPRFEFDHCSGDVSRRQFACAMAAKDADSIERCLTL